MVVPIPLLEEITEVASEPRSWDSSSNERRALRELEILGCVDEAGWSACGDSAITSVMRTRVAL